MPARTVVIEKLDKWNGETHANLTPGEYTQLTGRAGRRGIDVEGHAVVLWQPGMDPGALARPGQHPDLPAELQLPAVLQHGRQPDRLGRAGPGRGPCWSRPSRSSRPTAGSSASARQIRQNRQAMAELAASMTCDKGDFAEYAQLRRSLSRREGDLSRARATSRRAEGARSMSRLRPGDIIRVPGGRRAGLAIVLQPGSARRGRQRASRRPRPARAHRRPAGEAAGGGRLPGPAEVIDKIRIPGWFSPRSPQHRKDLASTMRNRLAARPDGATPGSGRPARPTPNTALPTTEVAELRQRIRRHPCHDCPDREEHARYAERYLRLRPRDRGARAPGGRPFARDRPHLRPGVPRTGAPRVTWPGIR